MYPPQFATGQQDSIDKWTVSLSLIRPPKQHHLSLGHFTIVSITSVYHYFGRCWLHWNSACLHRLPLDTSSRHECSLARFLKRPVRLLARAHAYYLPDVYYRPLLLQLLTCLSKFTWGNSIAVLRAKLFLYMHIIF